jgi:hypothetical protein
MALKFGAPPHNAAAAEQRGERVADQPKWLGSVTSVRASPLPDLREVRCVPRLECGKTQRHALGVAGGPGGEQDECRIAGLRRRTVRLFYR